MNEIKANKFFLFEYVPVEEVELSIKILTEDLNKYRDSQTTEGMFEHVLKWHKIHNSIFLWSIDGMVSEANQSKPGKKREKLNITPEIIDYKRKQLIFHRLIREASNELKRKG